MLFPDDIVNERLSGNDITECKEDDSNKTGQIIDKGQIAEKLDKYIGNQNEDMEYQIFGPEEEYKGTMIISLALLALNFFRTSEVEGSVHFTGPNFD